MKEELCRLRLLKAYKPTVGGSYLLFLVLQCAVITFNKEFTRNLNPKKAVDDDQLVRFVKAK